MPCSIAALRADELAEALRLIAGYQRFYQAEHVDDARNEAGFRRFIAPSESGLLLGARADGALVGFACLHWIFDSIAARDAVLLSDLFVAEQCRGTGVGRALIDAAAKAARGRGVPVLRWVTATDNTTAQALYDRTGATRSTWFEYELRVGGPQPPKNAGG